MARPRGVTRGYLEHHQRQEQTQGILDDRGGHGEEDRVAEGHAQGVIVEEARPVLESDELDAGVEQIPVCQGHPEREHEGEDREQQHEDGGRVQEEPGRRTLDDRVGCGHAGSVC